MPDSNPAIQNLGPAPSYFMLNAALSPISFGAALVVLLSLSPRFFEVPEVVSNIVALSWQFKLPAIAIAAVFLNFLFAYLKMVTTVYKIEDDCLIRKTIGLGGISHESMTLTLVVDCNREANWTDVALGLSTIHVRSADEGEPDMFLYGVPDGEEARKTILSRTSVRSGVLGTV